MKQAAARLLESFRFSYVALSGGEPLLYRPLDELISWLADRGQYTVVTTNGLRATRDRLSALQGCGLSAIQVSLLSVSPPVHDRIVGARSWEGAVRALAVAREIGLPTSVNVVVTRQNISELANLLLLTAGLGIKRVIVNRLRPAGNAAMASDTLWVSRETFDKAVCEARETADRFGIEVVCVSPPERPRGLGPWHRIAVTPDTRLKLCNQSSLTLGHVADFSEADLRALAAALESGDLTRYRSFVDNCSCLASYGLVDN
jgi:pyrroloquinoline quinone biosynthesis protein E